MAPGAEIHAVIAVPVADLHGGPTANSEVVSQAIGGDLARIEEPSESRDWMRIRLDLDDYSGWVPASSLRAGTWPPPGAAIACVRNLFAGLYRDPDVKSPMSLSVPIGTRLAVQDRRDSWVLIRWVDSSIHWIQAGDLAHGARIADWSNGPELRESLISTARRFLGLPYRWGGTTPWGLDCSGFIQLVFRLHGIALPRDARQQAENPGLGIVEPSEMSAGDLLFFNRFKHVGMAVSGQSFIHATAHLEPVVQVSASSDPFWAGLLDRIARLQELPANPPPP